MSVLSEKARAKGKNVPQSFLHLVFEGGSIFVVLLIFIRLKKTTQTDWTDPAATRGPGSTESFRASRALDGSQSVGHP